MISDFRKRLGFSWQVFRMLMRDKVALISISIIVVFIAIGILASIISPYPAQGAGTPNVVARLQSPSIRHLLGTDQYGRDILSRIFFGVRTSLFEGVTVVALGVIIGVPLGTFAGYFGKTLDEVIMRVTDIFLAFPYLLLALIIVATLGAGLMNVIIALAVTWWPWYTRISRSKTISLKSSPFILSTKALGVKPLKILTKHILPNSLTPIIIQSTLDIAGVILAAAGLSFLGLGVQEPLADLGLMISEGQSYFLYYWWVATFPGIFLFVIAIAFNFLGDSLRDVLDPRYQKRKFIMPNVKMVEYEEQ